MPLQIICRTRRHAPINTGDSAADNDKLTATESSALQLVSCPDLPASDPLKYTCWSLTSRALAACADTTSCTFAYTAARTPVVTSATVGDVSGRVNAGDTLTITGIRLIGARVDFVAASGTGVGECVVTSATDTSVACTVASMPAGVYTVRVSTGGGYADGSPTVVNAPVISSIGSPVGSLMGGRTLTIATAGVLLNDVDAAQNEVLLGGVPCDVKSVTADELTCVTRPTIGRVKTSVRPSLLYM